MVWFKVDDKLHSHPKTSNASLAAIGLWTLAGSWCGDHTTDGRIPSTKIAELSRGSIELADELVAAGFWARTHNGYRFHQWLADSDGTKRNPSKKEVEADRKKKSDAGRKGGLASGKARSKNKARASPVVPNSLNPRPSPSKEGSGGGRAAPLAAPPAPAVPPATPLAGQPPPAVFRPPADLIADTRERLRSASRKAHAAPGRVSPFDTLMALPTSPNGDRPPQEAPDESDHP